jgi:hypothetical protein
MNCLEFRRICLAEPESRDMDYLRHQQQCRRCAEYAASVIRGDKRLAEALRVDAPDNLASRIILRQSIFSGRAARRNVRRMYALAAGVLLAIGLAGGWFILNHIPEVDRAVIARINAVPASRVAKSQISNAELIRVIRTVGGELNGEIGRVHYASIYYVREHQCGQLIIQGAVGPVTILLMPGVYIDAARDLHSRELNGIVVPTTNGSMAIVGEPGEPLHNIEQRMRAAVTWQL